MGRKLRGNEIGPFGLILSGFHERLYCTCCSRKKKKKKRRRRSRENKRETRKRGVQPKPRL